MNALPLDGKVVLLTGAGGGLGGPLALALVEGGATVALQCRQRVTPAERLRALVIERGGAAGLYRADLTEEAAVEGLVDGVHADFGRLDVLVHAAGSSLVRPALETQADEWERVLQDNLTSAFLCGRVAAKEMISAGGGAIVNVASIAALRGLRDRAAYCAAKAGLVGFARSIAREYASRGITANVVSPGPVDTDMTSVLGEARQAELAASVPMGRFGTAEEVAAVVRFLASDQASYITGAVIPVDGGLGMGH